MSLYDTDFYAWSLEQGRLLETRQFAALDLPNLLEEVLGLGRSERHAVDSRLIQLVAHLLKWRCQPERRQTGHSWAASIAEQRLRLARLLRENPSLRPELPALLDDAYPVAALQAVRQTRLLAGTFPPTCPWTVAQVLADDFWPAEVRAAAEGVESG